AHNTQNGNHPVYFLRLPGLRHGAARRGGDRQERARSQNQAEGRPPGPPPHRQPAGPARRRYVSRCVL
ncbi:MAG: hypothetical protein AVDCRST_MAG56-2906, partial [uncultured Cytophagales bacterium]